MTRGAIIQRLHKRKKGQMDAKEGTASAVMSTEEDTPRASDALRNGVLPPDSKHSLDDLLLHNQVTFGRFFKNKEQYEMFMMLPITHQQRYALLNELCGRPYSQ